MRIQTKAVHFSADEKLINFVQVKLEKMEQYFNRIIDAQVVMKLENSGKIRDKIVEIHLRVPGRVLITKETHKTFEAAVDAASRALKKQLVRYKDRLQTKRI